MAAGHLKVIDAVIDYEFSSASQLNELADCFTTMWLATWCCRQQETRGSNFIHLSMSRSAFNEVVCSVVIFSYAAYAWL